LPQLEELVLDGTTIDNILPLSHAKNLRVLSLRRMEFLDSLRPLAALPRLRVLHVDDTVVSDLRPLADMTRLEEFSADRTWVHTVDPLRRLVRRHHLRQVSLRGTCVHTCEALHGADYDCSAPRQEPCFVPEVEFMPHYSKFAVPVALVERFAAPDLPLWSRWPFVRHHGALARAGFPGRRRSHVVRQPAYVGEPRSARLLYVRLALRSGGARAGRRPHRPVCD
jgi:hypothetical protein